MKTGPRPRIGETVKEIRRILHKEGLLSAKELQNLMKNKDVPNSYPKIKEALDLMANTEEISFEALNEGRGSIPKKVYRLKEKGLEKYERMDALEEANNYLDKMTLEEIRNWLLRFKKHGLRLRFTDNVTVKTKDGKVKGKGIGIVWDSTKYNTSFIHSLQTLKDGKVIDRMEHKFAIVPEKELENFVKGLVDEFKSWLKREGFEDLSGKFDKEILIENVNGTIFARLS